MDDLVSNQEGADTKVILPTLHALGEDSIVSINLRSPSGDTDIIVLSTALLYQFISRVFSGQLARKLKKMYLVGKYQFT